LKPTAIPSLIFTLAKKLTLKVYPERLSIFHNENSDRHPQPFFRASSGCSQPDHTKEMLTQRIRARQQTLLLAFSTSLLRLNSIP